MGGHKRIDETIRYVHVAGDHARPIPSCVLEEAQGEPDPDRRVLRMLSRRGKLTANQRADFVAIENQR
jgi:hypothetical protein